MSMTCISCFLYVPHIEFIIPVAKNLFHVSAPAFKSLKLTKRSTILLLFFLKIPHSTYIHRPRNCEVNCDSFNWTTKLNVVKSDPPKVPGGLAMPHTFSKHKQLSPLYVIDPSGYRRQLSCPSRNELESAFWWSVEGRGLHVEGEDNMSRVQKN